MITVGLIKECLFISENLKTPVDILLQTNQSKLPLKVLIKNCELDVWYSENHIWHESLEEGITMFGIESVATIYEIIGMIDNGHQDWKFRVFIENTT